MESIQSEQGSFTVEAVFVFSLILMILGGIMLFSLSLHDEVLQLSSAMTAGSRLRRGTEMSALEVWDPPAVRRQFFSETQSGFLISQPLSMETEISGNAVRIRCEMNRRIASSGTFPGLFRNASSACEVRFRQFSDPVELLLQKQAEMGKEAGF